LRTRVAGCAEFANVMVALCRAAGIPAQSISGLALPVAWPARAETQPWSHPAGAHAWVEFQTAAGWEFADPSWTSRAPSQRQFFGRTDGLHLSYGEVAAPDQILRELIAWVAAEDLLLSWMSAPNRFAAAASLRGVAFTPTVRLETGISGNRVGQ
jgi:hypothetical protein